MLWVWVWSVWAGLSSVLERGAEHHILYIAHGVERGIAILQDFFGTLNALALARALSPRSALSRFIHTCPDSRVTLLRLALKSPLLAASRTSLLAGSRLSRSHLVISLATVH